MPAAAENRVRWSTHRWAQDGDEWSPGRCAAGTTLLWYRSILPRIAPFIPAGTILEIGPGFGRWTSWLRGTCDRLILVDLTERCIEHCRARFADDAHLEYHVNDGASLAMIPDGSVDFVFSFDSLVHAEEEAVGAYLAQLARKLTPGGAGFFHHSNLGAYVNPRTGKVPRFVTRTNWRAPSVSAAVFRRQCREAGLACYSQELINWIGGGPHADRHRLDGRCLPLTDCLSLFGRPTAATVADTSVVHNYAFVNEWRQAVWMADFYFGARMARAVSSDGRPAATAVTPKLSTALRVLRRDGPRAVAALTGGKLHDAAVHAGSALQAHLAGELTRLYSSRIIARGQ